MRLGSTTPFLVREGPYTHTHSLVKKQAMEVQQRDASTWEAKKNRHSESTHKHTHTHTRVKRQAGDHQPRVNMREAVTKEFG